MSKPDEEYTEDRINAYLEALGRQFTCAGCMPMMGLGVCSRCVFHGVNFDHQPSKKKALKPSKESGKEQ
jgi:hypothetical protein